MSRCERPRSVQDTCCTFASIYFGRIQRVARTDEDICHKVINPRGKRFDLLDMSAHRNPGVTVEFGGDVREGPTEPVRPRIPLHRWDVAVYVQPAPNVNVQ